MNPTTCFLKRYCVPKAQTLSPPLDGVVKNACAYGLPFVSFFEDEAEHVAGRWVFLYSLFGSSTDALE